MNETLLKIWIKGLYPIATQVNSFPVAYTNIATDKRSYLLHWLKQYTECRIKGDKKELAKYHSFLHLQKYVTTIEDLIEDIESSMLGYQVVSTNDDRRNLSQDIYKSMHGIAFNVMN